MPLNQDKDSEGCYYSWGGRKFHYKCGDRIAREKARQEAIRFAFAITPEEAKREFG